MSYYTQQQILAAKRADIKSFLESHGETLTRKGNEYLWEKHQVWINGHNWYSHYEEVGGHAIDFVKRFYGLPFRDAVRELTGEGAMECVPVPSERTERKTKERTPLILPKRNPTSQTVESYLTGKRFISPEVVLFFLQSGTLYEDAEHHNCVFVGLDENGKPRHCHKRGTSGDFKQSIAGSDTVYSFHYTGTDDTLFVFEAPIDMLAYITMHPDGWQAHSYVALCSVADRALTHRLEVNPNLRKIFLCLDNDEAGQTAAERMKESLSARGYEVEILRPTNKDWDEDLKAANGVEPIPAGSTNMNTAESEDCELNENTEHLNEQTATPDPIDELMPYAEPMEKNEVDLLTEQLRAMYAPSPTDDPTPTAEAEETAVPETAVAAEEPSSSATDVSGNDDGKNKRVSVPVQNRLPEVPKEELALDPDLRKSDPEVDPYVHPYYKYGDILWYSKPVKDGETLVPLATFTPRLTVENNIHGASVQKRMYEIGGYDWQGDPLPKISIPAADLSRTQWVDNLLPSPNHLYVFNGSKEHFAGAIKSTGRFAEQQDTYMYTGWEKIDGEWKYLLPGVDGVKVELETGMDSYCLEPGCTESDLRLLASFIDGNAVAHDVLYPCIATVFLSPLNEFLRQAECEPKYLVLMIGESGNLKSSVSALMLCFFGKFTDQNLPMNFRDTANSIPHLAYTLKDVLSCVDDYHPANRMERLVMQRTLQTIIRSWGDHAGKLRMRPDTSLNPSKAPRGNVIVSAEYLPELGMSDMARLYFIEMDKSKADPDKLELVQKEAREGAFRRCMHGYVEWLKRKHLSSDESVAAFCSELSERFLISRTAWRKRLKESGLLFHNRLPVMLATMEIGFLSLLDFLKEKQVIDGELAKLYADEFDSILTEHAKVHVDTVKEEHPTQIYLRTLVGMVEDRELILEPKENGNPKPYRTLVGYYDSDYVYIFLRKSVNAVREACRLGDTEFEFSDIKIAQMLTKDGILVPFQSGNSEKIRVGHSGSANVRVTRLRRDRIEELCGCFLE